MASIPRSRLYYFVEKRMHFRVTVTLRATRFERWICHVKREFLNRAPENSKCVGLDRKYTDKMKNMKQRSLPLEKKQHTALL
jgi:hypothetical protein